MNKPAHDFLLEALVPKTLKDRHIDPSRNKLRTLTAICLGDKAQANDTLAEQALLRAQILATLAALSEQALQKGVSFAVVKGLAFEESAYGGAGFRDVGDLDILVSEEDLATIHHILLNMGYVQSVGPSSADGAKGRLYAAISATEGLAIKAEDNTLPIRRHPYKQELSPYVRPNHPTVEVHDGFARTRPSFLQRVIADASKDSMHLVRDPLLIFALLVMSTYENSESFYSNAFDYGVVLRDYVDFRCFLARHGNEIKWHEAEKLFEELQAKDKLGIVLGNLDDIYGSHADFGLLSNIQRQPSAWDESIVERLSDDRIARNASVRAFRRQLGKVATPLFTSTQEDAHNSILGTAGEIGFRLRCTNDALVVELEAENIPLDDKHYFQILLYPLDDKCPYLAYRVGLGIFDGKLRACGHKSHRFMQGATVKRWSGDELPVTVTQRQGRSVVSAEIARSVLDVPFGDGKSTRLVVSPSMYIHNHGNVYWEDSHLDVTLFEDVAMSCCGVVREGGRTLSARLGETVLRLAFDDLELAEDVHGVLPNLFDGWILPSKTSRTSHIYVTGSAQKGYQIVEDGEVLGKDLNKEGVSYLLMQAITDAICARGMEKTLVAHAGAVRFGENVVILMGPSGSGKTTLSLALSQLTPIMGDECVLIDNAAGLAWCEDTPILIKKGNEDALSYLAEGAFLSVNGGSHGSARYYPKSCVRADPHPCSPGKVTHIVFPRYEKEAEVRIKKMEHTRLVEDVLGSLMGPCPPSVAFSRFAHMVSRKEIELISLEFGNVSNAATALFAHISNGMPDEGRRECDAI